MFDNSSVLVTGATGAFGQVCVRTILQRYKVRRLIIFSRDELKQFEMQQSLPESQFPQLRYFLGDVRDYDRLVQAFRGVDYVIHAAALKQVPAAEYNPIECIKTNVYGAENVIRAAIANGVSKVIALSTDKAANPINLYGATKLCSDKLFIAGNNLAGGHPTRFAVVRYGNVVGSRGSVIPFFRSLMERGTDHLPITHAEMTRFWITLQQGVDFVLKNFRLMQGGELYVPKIPSMRVVDLARVMAPDLPQKIVGIRPGEKLHEVMCPADDAHLTLEFADHFIIKPTITFVDAVDYSVNADGERGEPVEPGFSYSSDNNTRWITDDQMRALVKAC